MQRRGNRWRGRFPGIARRGPAAVRLGDKTCASARTALHEMALRRLTNTQVALPCGSRMLPGRSPGNLIVKTHRADKDQTFNAGFVHRLHDVSPLPLQGPRKVRIHGILSGHCRFQRLHVQNVALHDAEAGCVVRCRETFEVPQVERQMCVASFQEQAGGYASNLAVCPPESEHFSSDTPKRPSD
jgi:hypothetical protein